ncbi:amidase [Mesorhizobium sp. M0091]|uniref:amidase n=1 Tax=Mesorhizobium sp. M0091 TaxID=2956875 RepID=UPI00333A1EA8
MSDITDLSALDLMSAVRSKGVSCVQVMESYLERISILNPGLNALVSLREHDELIAEARKADRTASWADAPGPLHGLPIAIKDIAETKSIRTTFGSPIYADYLPENDDIFVERIKRSGAIIIGKTNIPEFAMGSHTFNPIFGVTRNAYDRTKTAGGSSGGAAVSLAARLQVLADGSDHGGSLRNPAAFNNVFALRPSIGRVPAKDVDPFNPSMTVTGPMARSVEDLALLLSVMAGYDSRAPLSIEHDPLQFAGSLDRDFDGIKIAWLGDLGGHLPIDREVLRLCENSLQVFRNLGCTVEAAFPSFEYEDLWQDWLSIRSWGLTNWLKPHYHDDARRELLKPEAIWEIERGMSMTADKLQKAHAGRGYWYRTLQIFMEVYDYVLLPSAQIFPFASEIRWPSEINGISMDSYHRWMEVVVPITMSGCPALNVPVGFSNTGLPMGMQIVGRNHQELGCLQLAAAYDSETRWVQRFPPPAAG